MSSLKSINIPPAEIVDQSKVLRRNYEHIILWMLNNNEYCEWSDFIEDPVDIKKSTLSDKLRSLIIKGFVEKENKEIIPGKIKKVYQITPKGRERYNEISISKEERIKKSNYPPRKILSKRNYDHWILWMSYNNDYCTWSTFTAEDSQVRINQSSLSKNINKLLDNEFIIKVNKEYRITPKGRAQYSKMLREYDLDRQSILEEETNRIDEITEKTKEFFEEFEIDDGDLKFRFLNNILKLEYTKAEEFVLEEEFNKIILYLSMNYPDQYPKNVSPEEFSLKYRIKRTTLDFFVDKIVEENIYPIKFFKIVAEEDKRYFFQANGELEKILNAIVEKHITKFTYLNKFHSISENGNKIIDIEHVLDQILENISGFLFNEKLGKSLKKFLPEYINYLAYKIESEKKLIRSEDKLEAAQWQTFQSVFQGYNAPLVLNGNGNGEHYFSLSRTLFEALDIVYLSKIDFVGEKEFEDEFISDKNLEIFRKIISKLRRYKIEKGKNIFEPKSEKPEKSEKFDDDEKLILKYLISSSEKDFKASKKASLELISQKPGSYVGYLFQALDLFELNDFEAALKVVEDGLTQEKHYSLSCVKAQVLIKRGKTKDALTLIKEALTEDTQNVSLLRTKFVILLIDQSCWPECVESPLEVINEVIKLNPLELGNYILKATILCIMQKYKEVKKLLNKDIDLRRLIKNPRISTAKYFLLAYSYVARDKFEKALKKGDEVILQYENHPVSYFTKALAIGYGLIYEKEISESDEFTEANFLKMIEKAISLDSIKFHQAKYYQLMSDVFLATRGFEEANETIDKAINLDPLYLGIYETKFLLLTTHNKSDEALALIKQTYDEGLIPKRSYHVTSSLLYFFRADKTKDPEKRMELLNASYKELEPIIDDHQDDLEILNNLTVLYGHLGRKEEGIRVADKMISLNPSNGNQFDSYGEMLMLFGDYQQAIAKFEKALKLAPKGWFTFQTYLKMGTCYEKLLQLDKAEEYYLEGKKLTEKTALLKRDMYRYNADEKLDGLKKLREELKNKKE